MQRHVNPPEPFSHSMEPQLRKLGLSTRLERGVPTLAVEHQVCKEGDVLTPEQVSFYPGQAFLGSISTHSDTDTWILVTTIETHRREASDV
jgi:hypothetical protein